MMDNQPLYYGAIKNVNQRIITYANRFRDSHVPLMLRMGVTYVFAPPFIFGLQYKDKYFFDFLCVFFKKKFAIIKIMPIFALYLTNHNKE